MNEIEPLQIGQGQLFADRQLEPIDLAGLAAHEVVELYNWTCVGQDEYGDKGLYEEVSSHIQLRHDVGVALDTALENLVAHNVDRAKEIFTAFADSPRRNMRERIAKSPSWLASLTRADHDVGFAIWEKLALDKSDYVIYQVQRSLSYYMQMALPEQVKELVHKAGIEGFRLIPLLDEEALINESGLTRADVHSLFESYAYVWHDDSNAFDLAWAALEKVLDAKKRRVSSGD